MAKDIALERKLREFGLSILRKRYDNVTPIKGQGIQSGTRVEFAHQGKNARCAIKVTQGGRIHFPRVLGEWSPLKQVEFVLYVRPASTDSSKFEAQMHSQANLLKAFDENYEAAKARHMEHLPVWLSADKEDGDRFIGSGFGKQALWIELGTSAEADEDRPATTTGATAEHVRRLIEEHKRGLAAELGVSPDAIEIVFRF